MGFLGVEFGCFLEALSQMGFPSHFRSGLYLGFSPDESYWLLHAFGKTPNINHATTTGLESAGEKQLNPTVSELIENLLVTFLTIRIRTLSNLFVFLYICVGIMIMD